MLEDLHIWNIDSRVILDTKREISVRAAKVMSALKYVNKICKSKAISLEVIQEKQVSSTLACYPACLRNTGANKGL